MLRLYVPVNNVSITVGGRIRCVKFIYHDQLSWENFFGISGLCAKLNVSSQSVFFCFKRSGNDWVEGLRPTQQWVKPVLSNRDDHCTWYHATMI